MSFLMRRSNSGALRSFRPRNQRAPIRMVSRSALSATMSSNSLYTGQYFSSTTTRSLNNRQSFFSTTASSVEDYTDDFDPWGDLFEASVGPELVGKKAHIRRKFDAQSNALGLLTCGGQALAKHASFDPEYERARGWIQHHAVGPAVMSPVLIGGLVGALVEAAVPQSVPMASTMRQIRPLIVGVCRLCDFFGLIFPARLIMPYYITVVFLGGSLRDD